MAPIARNALLSATVVLAAACALNHPRRDPTGETLPRVQGMSLTGEPIVLPVEFRGAPVVLLVAWSDDAQVDMNRWLRGLLRETPHLAVRQLVTIPGFAGALYPGQIDAGTRDVSPDEEWGSVIQVQSGEERLAEFTGTEAEDRIRVILLDAAGDVAWFWDRGFVDTALQRLERVAAPLQAR